MMDPSIGWHQPEHKGPALDYWMKIWKDFRIGQTSPSQTNGNTSTTDDAKVRNSLPNTNAKSMAFEENPSLTIDLDNNLHLISKNKGTPWLKPEHELKAGIEGLSQEMGIFYDYIKPTAEEICLRKLVFCRLTQVIESLWSDVIVDCFGSTKTLTNLPTSDIDIVVVSTRPPTTSVSFRLMQLEQHLLNLNQCLPYEIVRLDKAAIPIIKMVDAVSRIQINVSFDLPLVIKSVALVNSYKAQYPQLVILLSVLKQFILQRDLNEVFKGGLSSYSVVLMIVHFFKANPQFVSGPDHLNLGQLLIKFFELYGTKLNYDEVGLRVIDGTYVNKNEILQKATNGKTCRYQPSLLCIEDPLDETNNVSRSSYAILTIREAFKYAFDMLSKAVGPNKDILNKSDSILGRVIRVTDEVVDRRGTLVHQLNDMLSVYNSWPRNGPSYHWGSNVRGTNRGRGPWTRNFRHGLNQSGFNPRANVGTARTRCHQQVYRPSRQYQRGRREYQSNYQTHPNGSPSYYSFDHNQNNHRRRAQQIVENAYQKTRDGLEANEESASDEREAVARALELGQRGRESDSPRIQEVKPRANSLH